MVSCTAIDKSPSVYVYIVYNYSEDAKQAIVRSLISFIHALPIIINVALNYENFFLTLINYTHMILWSMCDKFEKNIYCIHFQRWQLIIFWYSCTLLFVYPFLILNARLIGVMKRIEYRYVVLQWYTYCIVHIFRTEKFIKIG